jgi:hypothetical protein
MQCLPAGRGSEQNSSPIGLRLLFLVSGQGVPLLSHLDVLRLDDGIDCLRGDFFAFNRSRAVILGFVRRHSVNRSYAGRMNVTDEYSFTKSGAPVS